MDWGVGLCTETVENVQIWGEGACGGVRGVNWRDEGSVRSVAVACNPGYCSCVFFAFWLRWPCRACHFFFRWLRATGITTASVDVELDRQAWTLACFDGLRCASNAVDVELGWTWLVAPDA